jgi:hypothetical protein
MFWIAQSLGYSGSYRAARELFTLIAAAHRDSEDHDDHPSTLADRANRARWTGQATIAGPNDGMPA